MIETTASGVISPKKAAEFQPAEFFYPTRTVVMHQETDEEISALRGTSPTVSLAFLGIAIGAFGPSITTFGTQTLSSNSIGVFTGVAAATAFGALICTDLFAIGLHRVSRTAHTIRARATDPSQGSGQTWNWFQRVWRATINKT